MPKKNDQVGKVQLHYRYHCHGCTNTAGYFEKPVLNAIITCPHCGMEQLSKLENFIYEP